MTETLQQQITEISLDDLHGRSGREISMKVFQLDDCDWWVGPSLAACIAEARAHCGAGSYCDAEAEGREVDAENMDRLKFVDEEEDKPQTRTFAEQLARELADGGKFPRFFASTER